MTERWDQPGIPHKGWVLEGVEDIRDGSYGKDIVYETCEMCRNERIRFVHILSHPDYDGMLRVGCNCACKMTDDYDTPRHREKQLNNRSKRKENFLKRTWELNQNENYVLKYKGNVITAITRNGSIGFCYNKKWHWHYRGQKIFDFEKLKLAAFDVIDEE